jgi:hypothetical protein
MIPLHDPGEPWIDLRFVKELFVIPRPETYPYYNVKQTIAKQLLLAGRN